MNDAFFDPESKVLCVKARIEDILLEEDDGMVGVIISNLDGGIEIFHGEERLWRPA